MIKEPKYKSISFTCPHCKVVAQQHWNHLQNFTEFSRKDDVCTYEYAQCESCSDVSLWFVKNPENVIKSINTKVRITDSLMIYPRQISAPNPNKYMPQDIISIYQKASFILNDAPEASCTYLRICLEKLCHKLKEFEDKTKLATMINELASENIILPRVKEAMTSVRILGNDASHADQIIMTDNKNLATKLFILINIIVSSTLETNAEISSVKKITDVVDATKNKISSDNT